MARFAHSIHRRAWRDGERPWLRRWGWLVILAALVLGGAESGLSDDLLAPGWRGQPGSACQSWSFDTSNNPVRFEAGNEPSDPGDTASFTLGKFGKGWYNTKASFGTNQGFWDLGRGTGTNGFLTLTITNRGSVPLPASRFVWLQITQWKDSGIFSDWLSISIPGATYVSGLRTNTASWGPGGEWWVDQTLWRLAIAPAVETITITSPTNGGIIDQVIVDSLAVTGAAEPNLRVVRDGTAVKLAWPEAQAAFVLQTSPHLNTPIPWQDLAVPVVFTNGQCWVQQPAQSGNRFYRLREGP